MSRAYYKVTYGSQNIGFFIGTTWGEAQKAGASQYNQENGTNHYWGNFESKVILSKYYERYGLEPLDKVE